MRATNDLASLGLGSICYLLALDPQDIERVCRCPHLAEACGIGAF